MATSLIVESPVGPLLLVAEAGALVGVWMEEGPEPDSFPFGLSVAPQARSRRPARHPDPHFDSASLRSVRTDISPDPVLSEAREQLGAWFRGALREFDLPLRPHGTPFQQAVWAELRRIRYGETRTYGDIAASLGHPTASRAVGAANGRNPISIIVPCHRVIGAFGALTGYAGGLARKRWLLDHERAVLAR